ncbi:MAG: hypothetical protein RLZZ352_403 [Pseudomonadota bacterium]|jgi:hypothetical protein
MASTDEIRQAIVTALPITNANYGEVPNPRDVYLPPAHAKALRLECNLVIGARGVGKSFWTAALSDAALRASLTSEVKELQRTDVCIGFGIQPRIDVYPDKETFSQLMATGNSPYDIWRSVVVRWLDMDKSFSIPKETWNQTVHWVAHNPEQVARLVQQANQKFQTEQRFGLIVFDALDRTSDDWAKMDSIVRDLLRVVLWLKSFPRLHAKVFLREDQANRTITNFPDASKLLATKAVLTWELNDLHGLLWQMLCNADDHSGEILRAVYKDVLGVAPHTVDGVFHVSAEAKRDSLVQRPLFEALAGKWMGSAANRGVPYVWSVSHLADGHGRTSPRSFLAAIRQAAGHSLEKYPPHPFPLHYESIKSGVQKASEIRVSEMTEDYPWVTDVMKPLKNKKLTVPCEFSIIESLWAQNSTPDLFQGSPAALPPQHADRGWVGVRKDLERIGIFETMKDGRVNLPDLYRVGFGLGRRGGVKPVK